jgi:hypothetical protein
MNQPLLLIDVDGVISLFGFDPQQRPDGRFEVVDGIAHYLSATAGEHLRRLCEVYEPAWCTGWEEKANEYLPLALGLPGPFPHISFADATPTVAGHWKLAAIDEYAGLERPVAWIDDAHDERCETWAAARPGPTLLLTTEPATGITEQHVERLLGWSELLETGPRQNVQSEEAATQPGSEHR